MSEQNTIGLIGLGKMGYPMAEHLLEQAYQVITTDLNLELVQNITQQGAVGTSSLEELTNQLPQPKIILLSLPAGDPIDQTLAELIPHLSENDVVVDSSNSFYQDSRRRAVILREKNIYLLDVGISGGVSGARNGGCLMIGGDEQAFVTAKHLFTALSQNNSYQHLGPSGAGHFVKGIHNLVEYGYLQALVEGLAALKTVSDQEDFNLSVVKICHLWNQGSIVQSRLVEDAATALIQNPTLESISGSVYGQTHQEMVKLTEIAQSFGINLPACQTAIDARKESQIHPNYTSQFLNAIRQVFGGHQEWKKP